MTRRAITALLCLSLATLALPGLGWADPGGGASPGSGSSGPTGGSGLVPRGHRPVEPANQSVSSSANGVTIATSQSGFLSHELLFRGSVSSSAAGDVVEIERSGHETNGVWTATARATVQSDGSFSASWHADHIGRFAVRAVVARAQQSTAGDGSWPTVTVIVYRPSVATQYGPGFYGQRTACGQILRRHTIGLANRTLPCGTRVAVYYGGHMMVVPVIDRGPYRGGVDWDLTEATGKALGISGTARIGAVSLPGRS